MPVFKILSFDGGGVKGSLSTRLLKRILDQYPHLIDDTDMLCGTSTGAIIALALAYGKSPDFVDKLFNFETIKYIFSPSYTNWFRPKYLNAHLQEILQDVFPLSLTLGHLNKYVFVPSFYLKNTHQEGYHSVFFSNLVNNPHIKEKVIDIALSSCAAPTYFPPFNHFIDGGVIANSPTAAPILYTKSFFDNTYNLKDFRLLSIGTGTYPLSLEDNTSRWGLIQWSFNPFASSKTPLLDLLLADPSQLETTYAAQLLKRNFFRLNPTLSRYITLDDYKAVPELKKLADMTSLKEVFHYIDNFYLT